MKSSLLALAGILLATTADAQWNYITNGTSQDIYNNNTGNVGVGTTVPATKLHVANGVLTVSGNNPFGGPMVLWGTAPGNNNTWGIESTPSGLNFWRPFNGQANAGNFFFFLQHSNGNIGIKTNTPTAGLTVNSNVLIGNPATVSLPAGYKLYVESGILTEKVKVAIKTTGNWSDFVFDEHYKLPSLSEKESFIRENKHLPGIPSANEVVAQGIDLGEMNARLLQQIEELTLHMIRMEKEIQQLKQVQ